MNKQKFKEALNILWELVYQAAQAPYLHEDQVAKLEDALGIVAIRTDGDNYFNGMALHLCDLLNASGILSIPSHKPEGVEEILSICQSLLRHLDSWQD